MQRRFILTINKILERPEVIFVILAFIFGSIFIFKTPPFEVPDEPHHLLRTCEVAEFIFYSKTPVQYTDYDKYFLNIDKSSYIKENSDNKYNCMQREKTQFHAASRNSAIMYIVPALGIKIGSLFTQDGNILFYLGRFFNLFLYIFLSAVAIRITPILKYPFMYIALLPMALFQGMSYSADSFNNAFAFFFLALIFNFVFLKNEITKKDFIILSILSCICAMCKGLVFYLFLLLLLPTFSKEFRFKKYLYIVILILVSFFICQYWIAINSNNLNSKYPVINDFLYIFKYPMVVFQKICITSLLNIVNYFKQTIGVLGWLHIFLRPDVYVLGFMSFISMIIFIKEKISFKFRITALLIILASYFIIQYTLLIYWSNPNAQIINGFQGRYLIPMLPLLFILFANNRFSFGEKTIKIYKILLIISIIYILIGSCLSLNTFYNVLGFDRHLMDAYLKNEIFLINK